VHGRLPSPRRTVQPLKAIPSRSEHVSGERLDRVQIPRDHRVEQPSLDEEINPVLRQQLIDWSVQHRHCGWRDRPEPAEIGEQVHQRPRCQERRIPRIPTRPTEPLHSCIVKRVDAEILGREPAAQMRDNPRLQTRRVRGDPSPASCPANPDANGSGGSLRNPSSDACFQQASNGPD